MHAIRCREATTTESQSEKKGLAKSAKNETLLKRSRRGHTRRLPEGNKPTFGQIQLALEKYDIDLIRINEERKMRNLPKVTFVSEVEDVNYKTPIVSRAMAEATEELKKILKSGD